MFREEVAAYYRRRGYAIKENVKIRSPEGSVYAVDMVAQSSLGNLLIAFEDEGGFEGPEMNAVRRMAREIGATPVMAARRIPAGLRKQAAGAGVVLVDEDTVQAPDEPEPETAPATEPEYPPWPGSSQDAEVQDVPPWPRSRPAHQRMETREVDSIVAELAQESVRKRRAKSTDPGIWRFPRQDAEEPEPARTPPAAESAPGAQGTGFQWLPKEEAPPATAPRTVEEKVDAKTAHVRVERHAPPPRRVAPWIYVAMAVVFGATTAGVFYALSRLFG